MISIISAFGGQHIQDALYKDMQGQNMVFSLEDCSNGISLIMAVEQHPDVDVIVIGHTVVKDIETYLSQIREITKTARIVLLLNGKRHQYIQEQYEGYNRRYNVEDIIFEGDGIDKLKILSIMNKGRLTVEQEIKEEIHAENPSLAEKAVEKSKENSIENQTGKSDVAEFDIKPEAKPKREKPEKLKREKPKREKTPVIDIKPKKKKVLQHKSADKCTVISLFGTTHGAGVTNMTASLAEYLVMNGKKVIAFNLSGGDEFRYINGQAQYRDVKSFDISEFEKDYDVILIDLGTPYRISSGGKYNGFSDGYDYRNIEFLKKSSLQIVMSLSDAWHIKKCEYFLTDEQWAGQISNSYIFLFDTEPPKSLQKYAVNMFDRNSQSFAEEIARLFLTE